MRISDCGLFKRDMREKRERQERVISGISETRLDGRGQMTDDSTSKVRDQRSEIGGQSVKGLLLLITDNK